MAHSLKIEDRIGGGNLRGRLRKILIGLVVLAVVLVLVPYEGDYAHVVVMDQHGKPVEGVLVRSDIQPGNAFFSSGETTVEYTDEKGQAQFPVGRWFRFTRIEKEGYQFRPNAQLKRQYGSSMIGGVANEFTADDPLVIRAWKRQQQPELTYVGGKVSFPDDIEQCTLTLVEPTPENRLDEPLVWRFNLESDYQPVEEYATPTRQFKADQWRGWATIRGAELQDTNDLFMNQAPQDGYKKTVEWGPFVLVNEERERQTFIKGEGGSFYGGSLLFLRPDNGTKAKLSDVNDHEAYFQFWFNFDGSTNIMRNRNQTNWSRIGWQMDERVYCREASEN